MLLAYKISRAVHYTLIEPARQEPRVLLLALSTMFITMGQGSVVPIIPILVNNLGMTAAMVGIAVSAFALARVFTNIPAGLLTTRYGARSVLVLGAAVSAVGNALVGAFPAFVPLIIFRFVAGIGSALFITAAVAFVAEVSTSENRGRLMTIYQGAFLMGLTLGPSAGGITADLFGLAAPFYLVTVLSVFAGVWALLKIPAGVGRVARSSGDGSTSGRSERVAVEARAPSVFRDARFISISFIAMAIFFTRGGTLFNLWPLMVEEKFSLGPGGLGLLLTVPAAANLVFQPAVGGLADRVGRRALILPTVFLFAVSLLLSAVSTTMAMLAVALAIYGLAQAIESPTANAYVADLASRRQRPVALAVMRTFGDVGLVVGAPLLGLIADLTGISWGLAVNAVIILVAGVPFLSARLTGERKTADSEDTRDTRRYRGSPL